MRFREVNRWKWCCFLLIMMAVTNEWLLYILLPLIQWPRLPASLNSVKLLLVADPQLLGDHFTASGPWGFIARWDSDRFIAKTFHLAYHYIKPDVVVFLGDNFDEGEIADDNEFLKYLARFNHVFDEVDFKKAIVLAGDNDIGGEHEPPYIENEQRFDKYFSNKNFIVNKFLEFAKVNYMTQSNSFLEVPEIATGRKRIVLSHIPLIPMNSIYTKKVLQHLKPHLILSAHEHSSMHFIASRTTWKRTSTEPYFTRFNYHVDNLTETEVHEIMIPTCSYRMGTDKLGYGALTIGPNDDWAYTVLWLPSRISQLLWYLGISVFVVFLLIPNSFWFYVDQHLLQRNVFMFHRRRQKQVYNLLYCDN